MFTRIYFFALFLAVALLHNACTSLSERPVAFVVFSDPHTVDSLNRIAVLTSMIEDANGIDTVRFPDTLQFLAQVGPLGAIVNGDVTESGQNDQWQQYTALFGSGNRGVLQMPVYENFGNHDGDTSGVVRRGISQRNRSKSDVNVSSNGLFTSWDWGDYHFVMLGLYPANGWDSTCEWCHYFKTSFRYPQNSLDFLESDLAAHALDGKRVILFFHYGWDSFSKLWWTPNEQERFYNTIQPYRVAAIFTGHNHSTGHLKWKGIDVFSAGSPQDGDKPGSFLYVQIKDGELHVIQRRLGAWGEQSYRVIL